MGDHFEHVGYRWRKDESHMWESAYLETDREAETLPGDMETLSEAGWQVERLYRRCEDG